MRRKANGHRKISQSGCSEWNGESCVFAIAAGFCSGLNVAIGTTRVVVGVPARSHERDGSKVFKKLLLEHLDT